MKDGTEEMIKAAGGREALKKHMEEAKEEGGEKDPTGRKAKEPGAKFDEGKAPLARGCLQYFPLALEQVALVSLFGAKKYAWKGWESVPDGVNRYSDALARHLAKEGFEFHDPDSAFAHASHVAWNALARLELMLREKEEK